MIEHVKMVVYRNRLLQRIFGYRSKIWLTPCSGPLNYLVRIRARKHLKNRVAYRAFYEAQAARQHGNLHLGEENIRVKFALTNLKQDDEVLETGCQTGGVTRFLARRCHHLTAIDVSSRYIEVAKEVMKDKENVTLMQMWAEDIPWKGKFDVVFLMEVLEHVIDPRVVLERSLIALRSGGKLVITVPLNWCWPTDSVGEHARNYTPKSLAEELRKFGRTSIYTRQGFIFAVVIKSVL